VALTLVALLTQSAFGAENGAPPYAVGSMGYFAVPQAPGLYWLNQTSFANLSALYGDSGEKLPLAYHSEAIFNTFRILNVWSLNLPGGGLLASQVTMPVGHVWSRLGSRANSTSGLGNVTLAPAVTIWHLSSELTMLAGVGFVTPSATYNRNSVANMAVNYWSIQPAIGLHYIGPGLDIGISPRVALNTQNEATHYQSGNMVFLDYSVGWHLGDFEPGVVGGLWEQYSNDYQSGRLVNGNGNKSGKVTLGPSLVYWHGRFAFNINFQHSFAIRNAAGSNAIWFNVAIPLSASLFGEPARMLQ